jgi:hypothetical protein
VTELSHDAATVSTFSSSSSTSLDTIKSLDSDRTSASSLHDQVEGESDRKNEVDEKVPDEKPAPPLLITYKLPAEKRVEKPYRKLRHGIFTVYRRLFTLVIIANILGLVFIDARHRDHASYIKVISSAASANLFVAVAMRQDYVINLLCEVFAATPKSASLRLRRILTKVFEFGGVHSSAACCLTAWFVRLAIHLTMSFENGQLRDTLVLVFAYVLLLLFAAIVTFAHPGLRRKNHNTFERIHRFAGWLCSIIFWILIVLTAIALSKTPGSAHSATYILVRLPSFWLLSLNTIHSIIPWLRLRKLEATPEFLSDRALRLHLKANIGDFYTIRISDSPLSEWHSFAIFVDAVPRNGSTNSVVISKAGDWTSKTIASPKLFY